MNASIVDKVLTKGYLGIHSGIAHEDIDLLKQAVEDGIFGHVAKSGFRQEFYYSPEAEWRVMDIREKQQREFQEALQRAFDRL